MTSVPPSTVEIRMSPWRWGGTTGVRRIESVNETFKGQLNLEQHRGRTPGGVIARVMQRILTLTAAI